MNVQGVDVIAAAKDSKLKARPNLEIRYSEAADQKSFLTGLRRRSKNSPVKNRSWSTFQPSGSTDL